MKTNQILILLLFVIIVILIILFTKKDSNVEKMSLKNCYLTCDRRENILLGILNKSIPNITKLLQKSASSSLSSMKYKLSNRKIYHEYNNFSINITIQNITIEKIKIEDIQIANIMLTCIPDENCDSFVAGFGGCIENPAKNCQLSLDISSDIDINIGYNVNITDKNNKSSPIIKLNNLSSKGNLKIISQANGNLVIGKNNNLIYNISKIT